MMSLMLSLEEIQLSVDIIVYSVSKMIEIMQIIFRSEVDLKCFFWGGLRCGCKGHMVFLFIIKGNVKLILEKS